MDIQLWALVLAIIPLILFFEISRRTQGKITHPFTKAMVINLFGGILVAVYIIYSAGEGDAGLAAIGGAITILFQFVIAGLFIAGHYHYRIKSQKN